MKGTPGIVPVYRGSDQLERIAPRYSYVRISGHGT